MNERIFLPEMSYLKTHKSWTIISLLLFILSVILVVAIAVFVQNESILIFSFFYIVVVMILALSCTPLLYISKSGNICYVYSKTNRLYVVDLIMLNTVTADGEKRYQFKKGFGILKGADVRKFSPEQSNKMMAAISQAIYERENNLVQNWIEPLVNRRPLIQRIIFPLMPSVTELKDITLIKENKRYYNIAYTNTSTDNKETYKIFKIYPNFNPFNKTEIVNKPLPAAKYPIIAAIICMIMPFALTITSVILLFASPGNPVTYDLGIITYDIPENHRAVDERIYYDSFNNNYYGINGITPLGNKEPQEYFDMVVRGYQEAYGEVSADQKLEQWMGSDGNIKSQGSISTLVDGNSYNVEFFFVENKNIVISVLSHGGKGYEKNIDRLLYSITFPILDNDFLVGKTFETADEEAKLMLEDNGLFTIMGVFSVEGEYEAFVGEEAIKKLSSYTELGVTQDEINANITRYLDGYVLGMATSDILSEFTFDDDGNISGINPELKRYIITEDAFCVLIMTSDEIENIYCGYIIPEINGMELLNLKTLSQTVWYAE